MEPKKLPMDELTELTEAYMSEMSKTEEGRKVLKRYAAGRYMDGVSVIEQLPPELADEFTKGFNVVYERLIAGKVQQES